MKMNFSELNEKELEELMSGKGVSGRGKKSGRKEEIFGMLKEGVWSIKELGVELGISNRNVSSILSYLRDDGIEFREIKKGDSKGLVLWSCIRDGVKSGNRTVVGDKGKVVRYNFEFLKFEDEISDEERLEKEKEKEKEKKKK